MNHNSVIAVKTTDNKEYLILGKGAGFGKKIGEWIEKRAEDTVYALQAVTERGDAGGK